MIWWTSSHTFIYLNEKFSRSQDHMSNIFIIKVFALSIKGWLIIDKDYDAIIVVVDYSYFS